MHIFTLRNHFICCVCPYSSGVAVASVQLIHHDPNVHVIDVIGIVIKVGTQKVVQIFASSSRKHLAFKPPTTIRAASLAVAMRALRYQHKFVEVMGLRPTSATIDEEKRPPVAVLITNVLVVYCHSALAKPTAAAWLAINHGLHPDCVEIHVVVHVGCVNVLTPIVRAVNESQRHDE
jgi:hypothetical protein